MYNRVCLPAFYIAGFDPGVAAGYRRSHKRTGPSHCNRVACLVAVWMVALACYGSERFLMLNAILERDPRQSGLGSFSGPQVPAFFAYEELRLEPQTTAHPGT